MACMTQALGKKLTNARMVRGQMERILHARVPIIKFKHSATGQMLSLQELRSLRFPAIIKEPPPAAAQSRFLCVQFMLCVC